MATPVGSTPLQQQDALEQKAGTFCSATDRELRIGSLYLEAQHYNEACEKPPGDWSENRIVYGKIPKSVETIALLRYKLPGGGLGMVASISCVKATSNHTPKEKVFIEKLAALLPESILDGGAGQQKCKDLGQEIFDYYYSKLIANVDSNRNIFQGIHELKKILEKFIRGCDDGHLRINDIKRAWIGIGNEQWRWSDID